MATPRGSTVFRLEQPGPAARTPRPVLSASETAPRPRPAPGPPGAFFHPPGQPSMQCDVRRPGNGGRPSRLAATTGKVPRGPGSGLVAGPPLDRRAELRALAAWRPCSGSVVFRVPPAVTTRWPGCPGRQPGSDRRDPAPTSAGGPPRAPSRASVAVESGPARHGLRPGTSRASSGLDRRPSLGGRARSARPVFGVRGPGARVPDLPWNPPPGLAPWLAGVAVGRGLVEHGPGRGRRPPPLQLARGRR